MQRPERDGDGAVVASKASGTVTVKHAVMLCQFGPTPRDWPVHKPRLGLMLSATARQLPVTLSQPTDVDVGQVLNKHVVHVK